MIGRSTQRCACGCGEHTNYAQQTVKSRGWVKGKPLRWVRGHSARGEGGWTPPPEHDVDDPPVMPNPPPPAGTDDYALLLAHRAELLVGAVHDEGPAAVLHAIHEALALQAPAGIDPWVALVTVLAAQVDPAATRSTRLGWVEQPPTRPAPPAPSTRERGAA